MKYDIRLDWERQVLSKYDGRFLEALRAVEERITCQLEIHVRTYWLDSLMFMVYRNRLTL